ncbi:MAG: YoaK family protein [Eubacteriales bacterium]|nr:YoaK family protein [Eubacteriales bacterium]
MNRKEITETLAHHSMAVVGGFFGVYALFMREEIFGSSETTNLIYLVISGMEGSFLSFFVRMGAIVCYIAGIVTATLGPKYMKKYDFRFVSVAMDAAACLVLARIPGDVHPVVALYPMFFATAVQWLAFTQAAGFGSATIFSTNNLRQCFAGLTEYLHSRDPGQLRRFRFYGGTLLCFHVGVVFGWFCMRLWGIRSIYACLLPLALGAAATWKDYRTEPDDSAGASL